jgi:hypothetical protein
MYSMPDRDDSRDPLGGLRARIAVRLQIAKQDAALGDALAEQRNLAEARRMELIVQDREERA